MADQETLFSFISQVEVYLLQAIFQSQTEKNLYAYT